MNRRLVGWLPCAGSPGRLAPTEPRGAAYIMPWLFIIDMHF
jgi:hypothetical protein